MIKNYRLIIISLDITMIFKKIIQIKNITYKTNGFNDFIKKL